MIEQAANHLWQSTLVAAVAALLTLAFRSNRAQVRYGLWLAASLKFLIPFAALTALGHQAGWRPPLALVQPQMTLVVDAVAQPFSQPVSVVLAASTAAASSRLAAALPGALAALWLAGCAAILCIWSVRWRRVKTALRHATPVYDGSTLATLRRLEQRGGIKRPIAVVSSESGLEPGVFGIARPVLLWPRSIAERLAAAQVEAILAHELSHVRRRDNLAALLHMIVQALFWFHPLVWWLGARLIDERERACDEEVIRLGSEPQVYAESILKTCEFYLESRLMCAAGVTGSDLKRRIEAIMRNDPGRALNAWRKLLLAATAAAAIAAPVGVGALNAPRLRATSPATGGGGAMFERASVLPHDPGDRQMLIRMQPDGEYTATGVTLGVLIKNTYQLQDFQVVGGPAWLQVDRFDVVAKADGAVEPPFPIEPRGRTSRFWSMMRGLLADRFKLAVHGERRQLPVYALTMANADRQPGPQFRKSSVDCVARAAARGRGGAPPPPAPPAPSPGARLQCGMRIGLGTITAGGVTMSQITTTLSTWVNRVVVDKTDLDGAFDLDLKWTPEALPGARGQLPPGVVLPPVDPNGPTLFRAVQEQLGLKLEPQDTVVDVIVVDRAERPAER